MEEMCVQVLNEAAALVPAPNDAKLLRAMRDFWIYASPEELGKLEALFQLPLHHEESPGS